MGGPGGRSPWPAILIAAFVVVGVRLVVPPLVVGLPFGWDAVVYTEAARAVLTGEDPWMARGYGIAYAAPPPSLVAFLPFAWLPDPVVSAIWVGINAASALLVVRRLELPWYWIGFPPIVLSTIAGSTALPVTALMLAGFGGLGVFGRLYAALPYLVRWEWRPVLVGAGLVALTLPLWPAYLTSSASETLAAQSEGLSAL